jgi:hypothetical protein
LFRALLRLNPETRPDGRGQDFTYTSFEIMSHDGSVTGEVGVPATQPHTVLMETKRRLRELFRDALKELDAGPLGAS